MILKPDEIEELRNQSAIYIYAWLIRKKPEHFQNYYTETYNKYFGHMITGNAKYFKRLEEEGYIYKIKMGNYNKLLWRRDAPNIENLLPPVFKDGDEWDNIGKDGLVEW